MTRIVRLLSPYIAVGVFWFGFSSAWLAILAYHAQILFWSRGSIRGLSGGKIPRVMTGKAQGAGRGRRVALCALPFALAGPAMYFLIPHITRADLALWLSEHGLSGWTLWLMVPYYGILHPFLEQLHWAGLREETPAAHPVFAGYHLLVLSSLLTPPFLIATFFILTGVSLAWKRMDERAGDNAAVILSHVLADLGLGIAALMRSLT